MGCAKPNLRIDTKSSAAYNLPGSANSATKIFAPLIRRRHTADLLTTGVAVQNAGGQSANITITYRDSAGALIGSQTASSVASNKVFTFYQDALNTPLAVGSYGSAVITSNQPIVAVINDMSLSNTMDAANYNSLK